MEGNCCPSLEGKARPRMMKVSQMATSPQTLTTAKEKKRWDGEGCSSSGKSWVLLCLKGSAWQYKWEIPATAKWTSPSEEWFPTHTSAWNSVLTESFHFVLPDQTLSYPKALWEKSNLDKIPTWLLFKSQWGRREDFGKDPTLSQPGLCSEGHREEKRCLRRRGGATYVVSQTSCSIHNCTFKLCLMISGRVSTSQTHVAQLILLLPAAITGITECAAPWVDMTQAGLPDMWSSWTDTNSGSPC